MIGLDQEEEVVVVVEEEEEEEEEEDAWRPVMHEMGIGSPRAFSRNERILLRMQ